MYTLTRRNPALRRSAAALLAFVYAYFGFVAAVHHTDGFVATGKTLSFHSYACTDSHAEMAPHSSAPECGVCDFQASLTSPALPVTTFEVSRTAAIPLRQGIESLAALEPSTLHAPRAPPTA